MEIKIEGPDNEFIFWKSLIYCVTEQGGFGDHLTTTWVNFCLKTTMVVMVAIMLQKRSKIWKKNDILRPCGPNYH